MFGGWAITTVPPVSWVGLQLPFLTGVVVEITDVGFPTSQGWLYEAVVVVPSSTGRRLERGQRVTVKTWRSDAIAKKCTLSWNERDRALGPHGCPLDYGTPCREDAGAEIEQLQRLASVGRHAQLAGIFAWKDFGGRFFGSVSGTASSRMKRLTMRSSSE